MRVGLASCLLGVAAGCSFAFDLEHPDAAPPGPPDAPGGEDGTGGADAPDLDAPAVDGAPLPPDAMVDAVPCVAGDSRVVDPATGHCYTLHLGALSWPNARAACEALGNGAHLAVIESQAENDVVFGIVGSGRTWMGASDAAAEGTWLWIDGTPWVFTRWLPGDPTNGGGGEPGEDCLEMASAGAGEWNDNECFVAARYVCERD